jgi:putative ABC transport system permease protein
MGERDHMNYALATLWHDRQRYLPGILAVTFSAVLIALQCGLLLGLFSITSIPIDHTRADVWIGSPQVLSVDLGRRIPEGFIGRLSGMVGVGPAEVFIEAFAQWTKPSGGSELCVIVGSRLDDDAMGWVRELTPELRQQLQEPNAIVIDEAEFGRLGIARVGDTAEINNGHKVRVVGTVRGLKSLAGPYIFCSVSTARRLLSFAPDQTVYLLARCRDPRDARAVVEKLKGYDDMSAFTAEEFSLHSRLHWLLKTRAGGALGYAALLGLLVGAVVTYQTLKSATAAAMREYATLLALGIPRWRLAWTVVTQSFWVGVAGVVIALPTVYAVATAIDLLSGIPIHLPWQLLLGASAVTMLMAVSSGLIALGGLRKIEPVALLR